MPTPIVVRLADIDPDSEAYPGWLYLPGEPVRELAQWGDATPCDYCGNAMSVRGTRSPDTDAMVPQSPDTGAHDGIVSACYSPVPGCLRTEAGWGHLRCLLDSVTDLGTVTSVVVGNIDPVTVDTTPGAHTAYVRVPA